MKKINYLKSSDTAARAFFAYRAEMKKTSPDTIIRVVDFIAGWNAAKTKKK